MCFEFEALYWAKLAEEEDQKRREAEQKAKQADKAEPKQPAYGDEPVTA
jgi:hypothetical protein